MPVMNTFRLRLVAATVLVGSAAVAVPGASWAGLQFGTSASERSLAEADSLTAKRGPVLEKAKALLEAKKSNAALDVLEAYLAQHPGDVIAGNLYRKAATQTNLYDRPIRFFVGELKARTPCPETPPICPQDKPDCVAEIMARCSTDAGPEGPPSGLRYNLAFGYIDKIPVVGPMGAGFLSKRSIEQFRTALDEDGEDWIANYGVGMNYLHWPDYFEKNDSSIAYFERAIEIQEDRPQRPSDILAYLRLGDSLAKAGDVEGAREAWLRGVKRLGEHADLKERLDIPPAKLKERVTGAYNPNNSIGAIDTDISILWVEETPERVFSLLNPDGPVIVGGVGGQTLPTRADAGEARLFNWFRDNLPLLMNRANADKVSLKGIGAKGDQGAGIIAHNMIIGFMTQFRGDSDAEVRAALAEAPDYELPFFHEGVGMGLAAALDTSADGSLKPFAARIAGFDPERFDRLHYAGFGMWFGLAPTINPVRLRNKFAELDLRGQFYAYEGLGFSVALFKDAEAQRSKALLDRLPFASASTFAHGAGRGLWIKYGADQDALEKVIAAFPERFRGDLLDGYGMGVAFTRIHRPDEILERLEPFRAEVKQCRDYLTGAAMGLAIRYTNDPGYVRAQMKTIQDRKLKRLAPGLLQAAQDAFDQVGQADMEMHRNWRTLIHNQLTDGPAAALVTQTCEASSQ